MAPKSSKSPLDAARRASRMRVKVVIMELKGILPYITAPSMDDETRVELERVLRNQRDTLSSVLKAFEKAKPAKAARADSGEDANV